MKYFLTLLLTLSTAFGHGHINAGAEDTNDSGSINAGDKLKMTFEHGTEITELTTAVDEDPNVEDEFLYNGFTTFTALHQSSFSDEAPNYSPSGALSGSFLTMELVSITGPAGAKFAFYDSNASVPSWIYQIGFGGFLTGDGTITLTETAWFEDTPSDPFGHIHDRVFGVDLPGEYTVTWRLHDLHGDITGLLDSDTFTATYVTVPEPSVCFLVAWGFAAVAAVYDRRKKRSR